MKKLTLLLANWLIRKNPNPEIPANRVKIGMVEGGVSVVVNVVLFVIKITVGIMVNSAALIADAVHTLSDSATSVVVIAGFKLSQKPSDDKHPFGHGRIEPVATLIIAILLFVAGFELLHHSVNAIIEPSGETVSVLMILIISVTVIVKELLARFSYILGDFVDSDTLRADALHHRSDVFATLMVVVALVASRYGYFYVDGIMGCLVSLVILWSAYTIAKQAISPLLGEAPSLEFLEDIKRLCLSYPGVLGVHDIISHHYGTFRITSLHIEVSHKKNAVELHMIAENIEDAIGTKTNGIAVVHIDPVNKNHPGYDVITSVLNTIIEKDRRIQSFYDLKIIGETVETASIIFDLEPDPSVQETEKHAIMTQVSEQLKSVFPAIRTRIRISPKFCYTLPVDEKNS